GVGVAVLSGRKMVLKPIPRNVPANATSGPRSAGASGGSGCAGAAANAAASPSATGSVTGETRSATGRILKLAKAENREVIGVSSAMSASPDGGGAQAYTRFD